jgi:hypothetical protein
MTRHTYPTSAMLGDYFRAAAGFIPTAAIFATVPVGVVAAMVLGAFATLFAVFGIRTMQRHWSRFEITESELREAGLLRTSIAWEKLDRVRLSYYSTRRDRRNGWMQLELRSGHERICVDSRIEGFSELVEWSVRAAEKRGLPLNSATLANLAVLGVKSHAVTLAAEHPA